MFLLVRIWSPTPNEVCVFACVCACVVAISHSLSNLFLLVKEAGASVMATHTCTYVRMCVCNGKPAQSLACQPLHSRCYYCAIVAIIVQ